MTAVHTFVFFTCVQSGRAGGEGAVTASVVDRQQSWRSEFVACHALVFSIDLRSD